MFHANRWSAWGALLGSATCLAVDAAGCSAVGGDESGSNGAVEAFGSVFDERES